MGFAFLLARSEGQGVGELEGNAPDETIYIVDAADVTRPREICHIKGIIRAVMRDAETGGDLLA